MTVDGRNEIFFAQEVNAIIMNASSIVLINKVIIVFLLRLSFEVVSPLSKEISVPCSDGAQLYGNDTPGAVRRLLECVNKYIGEETIARFAV